MHHTINLRRERVPGPARARQVLRLPEEPREHGRDERVRRYDRNRVRERRASEAVELRVRQHARAVDDENVSGRAAESGEADARRHGVHGGRGCSLSQRMMAEQYRVAGRAPNWRRMRNT
jgi:hypothetical protein